MKKLKWYKDGWKVKKFKNGVNRNDPTYLSFQIHESASLERRGAFKLLQN